MAATSLHMPACVRCKHVYYCQQRKLKVFVTAPCTLADTFMHIVKRLACVLHQALMWLALYPSHACKAI